MPSWITHLATANEVTKKITITNKNSFLVGNLIPDAERHVITDFSVYVPYEVSHYSGLKNVNGIEEKLPDIDRFMENYKNYLYNPMVLGYLTHILTDYYWNKTTSIQCSISDGQGNFVGIKINTGDIVKCNKSERNKVKHKDFAIFANELIGKGDYTVPKYEESLLQDLKIIKEIPFNKEDINKIIDYINNLIYNEKVEEYTLFTKNQINVIHKNCIEFVIEYLNKTLNK